MARPGSWLIRELDSGLWILVEQIGHRDPYAAGKRTFAIEAQTGGEIAGVAVHCRLDQFGERLRCAARSVPGDGRPNGSGK